MTKIRLTIVSACLLLTTGAFAQTDAQKAEQLRQSSEMMKPPTNPPARSTGSGSVASPVSAEERKAQERRQSSEMMKPPSNAPARPASSGSTAAPMSDADRKAAEARRRSEMMKPN